MYQLLNIVRFSFRLKPIAVLLLYIIIKDETKCCKFCKERKFIAVLYERVKSFFLIPVFLVIFLFRFSSILLAEFQLSERKFNLILIIL